MNAVTVTKFVVRSAVGLGTSKIVHSIIKNNIQPEKTIENIEVATASMMIGMMAADATKKYTDAKIDEYVAAWKKLTTKIKETEKEEV